MNMNISAFVAETLVQICDGVLEANKRLEGTNAVVNPDGVYTFSQSNQGFGELDPEGGCKPIIHLVHFDVAVHASKDQETKGSIGIVVASIGLGSQGRSEAKTGSESRIRFDIPILLPRKAKAP